MHKYLSPIQFDDVPQAFIVSHTSFLIDDWNVLLSNSSNGFDELGTCSNELGVVDVAKEEVTFADVRHDLILSLSPRTLHWIKRKKNYPWSSFDRCQTLYEMFRFLRPMWPWYSPPTKDRYHRVFFELLSSDLGIEERFTC